MDNFYQESGTYSQEMSWDEKFLSFQVTADDYDGEKLQYLGRNIPCQFLSVRNPFKHLVVDKLREIMGMPRRPIMIWSKSDTGIVIYGKTISQQSGGILAPKNLSNLRDDIRTHIEDEIKKEILFSLIAGYSKITEYTFAVYKIDDSYVPFNTAIDLCCENTEVSTGFISQYVESSQRRILFNRLFPIRGLESELFSTLRNYVSALGKKSLINIPIDILQRVRDIPN